MLVAQINPQRAGADDAGNAHATSHDGRMAGHPASGRQDSLGRMHAVDVLGARLDPHQDDLAACSLGLHCLLCRKDDLPSRRTGGCGQTGPQHHPFDPGIDGRMQELVERGRFDARHRLLLRNHALVHQIDGDLQGGARGALAGPGLQHPELAALDRELKILHVPIVGFQPVADRLEFPERLGHQLFHRRLVGARGDTPILGERMRGSDPRHDILALRIDQELPVELLPASGGIAREGNAGRRGGTEIAEDHGLHVDGRAPVFGDAVEAAIGRGAGIGPAQEDPGNRLPELHVRILREALAQFLLDHLLVQADDVLPFDGGKISVVFMAIPGFLVLEDFLEDLMVQSHDDIGIHLNEAPVAVPGETGVAGIVAERLNRLVIQSEVEDRVHHAGHGRTRARADGQEERTGRAAERPAGLRLHGGYSLQDLFLQPVGKGLAVLEIPGTRVGNDRQTGRNGQSQACHLCQVGTLAAQHRDIGHASLGLSSTEAVNPLLHQTLSTRLACLRTHTAFAAV